ncbi:MAG: type II toxin-antitoxin system PemK/MazF family toxin [Alphaproteobacteria bacterium]|nr:type II toxin-antitoxin system PemK/MazF family toxin [Alphaproteobacteria bacterium]
MKKGAVWTASGGADYAGKPRPVVILQDDHFQDLNSVTICAFTSNLQEAPILRLTIQPEAENGLEHPSQLMIDKITTVPKAKLGRRIGRLGHADQLRLQQAVLVFLGYA